MKYSVLSLLLISLTLTACNDSSSSSRDDDSNNKPSYTDGIPGTIEDWQSSTMGQEGHGGDAIVCFSIPVDQALVRINLGSDSHCAPNGSCNEIVKPILPNRPTAVLRMTEIGRKSISSAKPLEQYLAERIQSKKLILDKLNQMSEQEGYELIMAPFLQLPGAFHQIADVHQKLGWFHEDGIASEYGLRDINDSGFMNENEIDRVHCKELQAVVRRDNQLWYDKDIARHFDTAGRILMQLHEEIYTWGKGLDEINKVAYIPAHETSEKTRRFILKILDDNISVDLVNKNLKSSGFSVLHWTNSFNSPVSPGYYMDTSTCLNEQKYIREYVAKAPWNTLDFWLATKSLFSNRYLKDGVETSLEARFNHPPALADMMAFTYSHGSGGTYRQDLELLLQKFEKPEACVGAF